MKVFLKKITISYLALLLLTLGLLFAAYSIPKKALIPQINTTLELFRQEGAYSSVGLAFRKIVIDSYTDTLMVNIALTAPDNSLRSLLFNERTLAAKDEINQLINLEVALQDQSVLLSSYERYWHGYLIFLRPLLAFLSYAQIRLLLHGLLLTAFAYLIYLVHKTHGLSRTFGLFLGLVAVDFFYVGQSIQFSQVFAIGLLASIMLLARKRSDVTEMIFFFVVGMLTAFFDLLTAPLVTLGLLIYTSTKHFRFLMLLKKIGSWFIGYGLFWMSKWLLVETLFSSGAITNAWGHVVNRTVNPADDQFSHIKAIMLNINQLIGYDRISQVVVIGLIGIFVGLLLFFRNKYIHQYRLMYWSLVALIPYAWYLVTANHSYLHVWYTYRTQFITVAAGFMAYAELIDWERLRAYFFEKRQRKPTIME
jgi:hypothetical protein